MAIMDYNNHLQPDYNAPRRVPQGPTEEELRQWYEEEKASRRAALEKSRREFNRPIQYMGGAEGGGSFDGPYLMGDMIVNPDSAYRGMTPQEAENERLYRYYMATRLGGEQ